MDFAEKDRIGQYLVPHLHEMIFDELSEGYLKKAGIEDILTSVPVPIRVNDANNISVLSIAKNMAFVIGCDPNFKYKDNYVAYIIRNFDKRFAQGLIGEGLDAAEKNDYDYACILFRAAILIDPDNAVAYYCYGRALKDAYELADDEDFIGRFKAESLSAFEIATLKDGKLAEAFYYLGYAYLNMGLYIKAKLTWMEYLKLAEEKKKENDLSDDIMKLLNESISDVEERMKQLEEPVKIEEGYNLILSNKFQEGIKALLPYKESEFKNWWPLWYYLGVAYENLKDYENAHIHYKTVLNFAPSNLDAMEALVRVCHELEDEEGVEKYRKKLDIVKSNMKEDENIKNETVQ